MLLDYYSCVLNNGIVFAKELWRERRAYLTIVVRPLVLITLLIWACLPVYVLFLTKRALCNILISTNLTLLSSSFWGALSNSPKYTPNLEAWFINRDGGRIGNTLWDSFNNKSAPATLRLGWVRVDPAAAGTDGQIMDAIVQQQAWVAVVSEYLFIQFCCWFYELPDMGDLKY